MTDPAAGATAVITAGIGVTIDGIEVIIAGIEGIDASMIVSETAATGEMLDFSGATEGMTTFATVQTEGSMVVRSTSLTPFVSAETEASQRFAIRQINSA
jgi:hypothetical protein